MNGWGSFFADVLWFLPWRNPLGRARQHQKESDQRLRIALERELQFKRNSTPDGMRDR
jgi:hypothetical protein